MKKKLLLLSTVGAAAGLIYALESNWRKQSGRNASPNKDGEDSARNGKSAETSQVKNDNSNGHAAQAGSMARTDNGKPAVAQAATQPQIDDQGTDQAAASHILREIRDQAFEASDERLALALGRPTEEIEAWTAGTDLIDGDVLMKARALANLRGLEVE